MHGVVKLVLVVAILRGKLWAYLWMIGVLLAFIAYQIHEIVVAPDAALVALTVFDALIAFLTLDEYKRHRIRTVNLWMLRSTTPCQIFPAYSRVFHALLTGPCGVATHSLIP